MIRCSEKAFAKCPTRALCGSVDDATFAEGSECDRFNQIVEGQPLTYGDKIRMLSDQELLAFIKRLVSMGDISGLYCANLPECKELVDFDEPVPQEWCDKCLLEWLQREAEGQ